MGENRPEYRLVEILTLKSHEEADPKRLSILLERIMLDGCLKKPIAVDKNTSIVIDGEHRLQSLKKLRCIRIPVVLVDYMSEDVLLFSRRKNLILTKADVIEAAFSRRLLPAKTTKHIINSNGRLRHISSIEKPVNIPLSALGGDLKSWVSQTTSLIS
ncbi:MAG: ParB N-terminal domain-containing protein [Nitrososphaeria archaeon]